MDKLMVLWDSTALAHFESGQLIMMAVGFLLLFLAIVKKFEPLLLIPIGFGALLTNIPLAGFSEAGGLLHYIYGCRTTLGSGFLMVVLAMLIGVSIGTFAGMLRGVRSSIVNHLLDALMAIPTLLIAIIIVAILGTGLVNSMWAITLALIPQFVHRTRTFVRAEMKKEYIMASKLDGANRWQLFVHSILPNMTEMLVVQGTVALSIAVIDVSALGFLNLGAQSPLAELGAILGDGLDVAYLAPWNVALPGIAIFLLVLSINIVGDGLRSALRKE